MRPRSYFYCGFTTTLNIIVNVLTFGKYLWLEGRVSGRIFRNWARRFKYKPENFVLPSTEEEIIDIIKTSGSVRLFGAGHPFNDGVVSDLTLISLDNYEGIVSEDLHGFEKYYEAADVIIKDIKARPHLGKFGLDFDKSYMAGLYGENFDKFLQLMHKHDPEDKFANALTRRLFRN